MTIVRASKDVLAALILTSFLTSGAVAQAPIQQQSTNQIVGREQPFSATEQPKSAEPQRGEQPAKQIEQAAQPAERAIVIPPAPVVIKKNPNLITIPQTDLKAETMKADALNAEAKQEAAPAPKFEERPAVSSSVSIGSLYGYRIDPFTRRARFHSGLDIKARWGETVGASQAGVVQFAGWYHGYGNLIIVDHGGGVTTHYAHLSSFDVEVGRRVVRGEIIGRAGSTGRATSPHLHYEVRIDGNPVNPFQPLALDPSSEFFKQSQPVAEEATRPRRVAN